MMKLTARKVLKKTIKKMTTLLVAGAFLFSSSSVFASQNTGTWKNNSKGWWYRYSDGSYVVDDWLEDKGKWYYFNAEGYMVTGWKYIDGNWYFFNASGAVQTGWKKIGGKWYFFKSSGAMATGWIKSGNIWYWLDPTGVMVSSSCWKIGKKLYDFNSSGACTTPSGCTVTDKEAYDEKVLVKEAYDEVVKEAWDEKVLVKEAWTEQKPVYAWVVWETSRSGKKHARGTSKDTPGAEYVMTGYETIDHEAEYKTVHHKAETVHHNAEYKTVHHDAVTHTETYCKTCGATK